MSGSRRLLNLAATLGTPSSRPHLGEEKSRTSPTPHPAHDAVTSCATQLEDWMTGIGFLKSRWARHFRCVGADWARHFQAARNGVATACGATCLSEWGPVLGCSRPRSLIVSLRENAERVLAPVASGGASGSGKEGRPGCLLTPFLVRRWNPQR